MCFTNTYYYSYDYDDDVFRLNAENFISAFRDQLFVFVFFSFSEKTNYKICKTICISSHYCYLINKLRILRFVFESNS